VVLPEEDDMVGNKGMKYFETCWGEDRIGEGMDVKIVKLIGTDHDTTSSPTEGYLHEMFEELKSRPTVS